MLLRSKRRNTSAEQVEKEKGADTLSSPAPVLERSKRPRTIKPITVAVTQARKGTRVSIYQGDTKLPHEFVFPSIDTSTHPLSYGDDIVRSENVTLAVLNYGRFQPPTIGHGVMIRDIYNYTPSYSANSASRKVKDTYIFITKSCNEPTKYHKSAVYKDIMESKQFESCRQNENPLNVYQRTFYMKTMFAKDAPKMKFINCIERGIDSPISAIKKLVEIGYEKVIFKCGSDRVSDFKFLESMFPGVVQIEMAGSIRDEEGTIQKDIQPYQMSGTKMRFAAVEGKILSFKRGLMVRKPGQTGDSGEQEYEYIGYMNDDLALQLMNDIRNGLQTNLKPLRKEELVQMGGACTASKQRHLNRTRAFKRFVKGWLSRKS